MYNSNNNFVYLTCLSAILGEVQGANLTFEAKNSDHIKLYNDLYRLLQNLTCRLIINSEHFNYIEGDIDSNYNGYNFEKACNVINKYYY